MHGNRLRDEYEVLTLTVDVLKSYGTELEDERLKVAARFREGEVVVDLFWNGQIVDVIEFSVRDNDGLFLAKGVVREYVDYCIKDALRPKESDARRRANRWQR